MTVLSSPATRENLNEAIETTQPHLVPVLKAVRDLGLGLMFVPQAPDAFRIPRGAKGPTLTIIGDDMDEAFGPGGFHLPSVRRLIRASHAFAVVSSEAMPIVYGTMATTSALTGQNAVLIETRPEQEIPWLELLQKLAPRRPLWLSTVKGGHA